MPTISATTKADSGGTGPRDVTGGAAREEATWSYVRSPEDVLRVVTFAVLAFHWLQREEYI